MENEKKYYTYVICNPLKPGKFEFNNLNMCFLYEPIYIGKGTLNRMYSHYSNCVNDKSKKSLFLLQLKNENIQPIYIKYLENVNQNIAFENEKFLIKNIGRYDLNAGPLFNLTDGADGGNFIVEKTRKVVYQLDENKNIINEYLSLKIATKKTGLYGIGSACKNKKFYKGYYWIYKSEYSKKIFFKKSNRYTKVYQFDLSNNFINEYDSITAASKKTGIKYRDILRMCYDKALAKYDFYFKLEKNNKDQIKIEKNKTFRKVVQILKNEEIIFDSVQECLNKLKITYKICSSICKSKTYTIYTKYILYYLDEYEKGLRKKFKETHNNKKIKVINKNDKKEVIYQSINKLLKDLKIERKIFYKCLNKEIEHFDFIFENL